MKLLRLIWRSAALYAVRICETIISVNCHTAAYPYQTVVPRRGNNFVEHCRRLNGIRELVSARRKVAQIGDNDLPVVTSVATFFQKSVRSGFGSLQRTWTRLAPTVHLLLPMSVKPPSVDTSHSLPNRLIFWYLREGNLDSCGNLARNRLPLAAIYPLTGSFFAVIWLVTSAFLTWSSGSWPASKSPASDTSTNLVERRLCCVTATTEL